MAANKDFTVEQGKTFQQVIRWEAPPIIYKEITGITQAAPARITVVGHGIPEGWRVTVVSVKGMTAINAESTPPRDSDYHAATVIDADTIELNAVNSADMKAYVSGGYVQFNTPVPLAGYTARMSIRDKVGGTELLSLTTENLRIVINNTDKSIRLSITAADTAALAWKKGVYDLELVSPDGVVTALLTGKVVVSAEVTT